MPQALQSRTERLAELASALPAWGAVRQLETPEEQSRAALRCLIDRIAAEAFSSSEHVVIPDNPANCPNCDIPVESTRSPYCGEECREISGFVRQVRSGLADGSILVTDRQVALGQVMWHLLGGGRPLRREIVPERGVAAVLKRANGICEGCGAPATTVDHIATGCNRPINLRAVCDACCRDVAFGSEAITSQPMFSKLLSEFTVRIASQHPIRCCDDAATWDWRTYLTRRKQLTP